MRSPRMSGTKLRDAPRLDTSATIGVSPEMRESFCETQWVI